MEDEREEGRDEKNDGGERETKMKDDERGATTTTTMAEKDPANWLIVLCPLSLSYARMQFPLFSCSFMLLPHCLAREETLADATHEKRQWFR